MQKWALAAGIALMTVWGVNFVVTKVVLAQLGVAPFLFLRFLLMPILGFALLAFAGIVVFLSDKFVAGLAVAGFGDLVLLFAASLFSLYTVIAKPLVTKYGPLNLMCYSLLFGAPPMLLITLPAFVYAPLEQVTAGVWFATFWAIAVSSFVGWIAWAWVNSVRGIARSAPLQYLMPPIAGLVAWLTLGETFTWLKIAGATVAMAGVAWAQFGAKAPAPPDAG